MSNRSDRVRRYLGMGADGQKPEDTRTLLQVLIGCAVMGAVAGLVWALFGGDAASSVGFGVIMGILFLTMDLGARRRQRPPS
ncbi:hypothetical protein [Patulibacter americanus]|uniref:hypothetical protein n=1 Tax=Patulibacter americanus TaxID=588672 RepID=UPI0003B69F10|nr:hypothetical protein [Patulibacter americanus]